MRNTYLLESRIFHNVAADNRIRSKHDVFMNYHWSMPISNTVVADLRYPNSKFLAWVIYIQNLMINRNLASLRSAHLFYKFLKLEQYYLYLNGPRLEYIIIQLVWNTLEIYNYKYQLNSQTSLIRPLTPYLLTPFFA